jgi:hypothetical protein
MAATAAQSDEKCGWRQKNTSYYNHIDTGAELRTSGRRLERLPFQSVHIACDLRKVLASFRQIRASHSRCASGASLLQKHVTAILFCHSTRVEA